MPHSAFNTCGNGYGEVDTTAAPVYTSRPRDVNRAGDFFMEAYMPWAKKPNLDSDAETEAELKQLKLMDFIKMAIDMTCQRTGWDWRSQRVTETFGKFVVWLDEENGAPVLLMDLYFDLQTSGHFFRGSIFVEPPFANELKDRYLPEANAFWTALAFQVGILLKQWKQSHSEDDVKINPLLQVYDKTKRDQSYVRDKSKSPDQSTPISTAWDEEITRERRRTIVRKANALREQNPSRTWGDIAREIGIPERTLREWRHNPHCQ